MQGKFFYWALLREAVKHLQTIWDRKDVNLQIREVEGIVLIQFYTSKRDRASFKTLDKLVTKLLISALMGSGVMILSLSCMLELLVAGRIFQSRQKQKMGRMTISTFWESSDLKSSLTDQKRSRQHWTLGSALSSRKAHAWIHQTMPVYIYGKIKFLEIGFSVLVNTFTTAVYLKVKARKRPVFLSMKRL